MQYYTRHDQFSSVAQLCLTLCDPWTAACQASLSFTISWSWLKLKFSSSPYQISKKKLAKLNSAYIFIEPL